MRTELGHQPSGRVIPGIPPDVREKSHVRKLEDILQRPFVLVVGHGERIDVRFAVAGEEPLLMDGNRTDSASTAPCLTLRKKGRPPAVTLNTPAFLS